MPSIPSHVRRRPRAGGARHPRRVGAAARLRERPRPASRRGGRHEPAAQRAGLLGDAAPRVQHARGRERVQDGRAAAVADDLQLHGRGRADGVRGAERDDGARPHARVAQPAARLADGRELHARPDDRDHAHPHPDGHGPLPGPDRALGRGERGDGGRHGPAPHGFVLAPAHRPRLHSTRLPVRPGGGSDRRPLLQRLRGGRARPEVGRGLQPRVQPAHAGRARRRRRLADAQDQPVPHPVPARPERAAPGGPGRRDRDHRDGRAHRAAVGRERAAAAGARVRRHGALLPGAAELHGARPLGLHRQVHVGAERLPRLRRPADLQRELPGEARVHGAAAGARVRRAAAARGAHGPHRDPRQRPGRTRVERVLGCRELQRQALDDERRAVRDARARPRGRPS